METSGYDDPIFNEFSPDTGVLSPMGPKAIQQHHQYMPHLHHPHHAQTIMIGNGELLQQHQRLPEIHQILPGNSPKMDHYKAMEYAQTVKLESSYSSNGKMDYVTTTGGPKLEYTTNGHYSSSPKLIEYSTTSTQNGIDHIQMFQHPQPVDNNQQQHIINGLNGTNNNFKRKSDENLNNLSSGSPTPSTVNAISVGDATPTSSASPNKKPLDKKKNDPNGVKKKKTR